MIAINIVEGDEVVCVAAIAAVKREMGSGLKAALVVVLQCLVAWVVALLVYQVGGLLL